MKTLVKAMAFCLLVMLMIFLVAFFSVSGTTVDVTGYKGDGRIAKSGAGFIAKGYRIDFSPLQARNDTYFGEYTLNHMPKLDKDCAIYIKISEPYQSDRDKVRYTGDITLTAKDAKANIILNIKSNLSDWVMTSLDGVDTYLYFQDNGQFSGINFTHLKEQPIILRVAYKPSSKDFLSSKAPINVVLQAGGSK